MPRDKDLKRLVRARMQKTGESYTAARSRVVSKTRPQRPSTVARAEDASGGQAPAPAIREAPSTSAAVPVADAPEGVGAAPSSYAAIAGMSDEALEARTGCSWEKWVYVLDRHKAHELSHTEIARLVHEKYDIEGWWAQCVTVGYERIRGLRERGQRRGGGYEASKSKTFNVPVEVLFDAFAEKRKRNRWLPEDEATVRTAAKPRSMRLGLADGTIAGLWFTAKGDRKSSVTVQHMKLPDKAAAERSKTYWGARLGALADLLGEA